MGEGGVVEGQLLDGVAQILEVGGIHREQAAEHHGDRGLEARQHLRAGAFLMGDGVAHAGVAHLLDRGGEEAEFARAQLRPVLHHRREHAHPVDLVVGLGGHHPDLVALLEDAVADAHQHHDAEIRVVPRIDQHRLERRVALADRGGEALDDGLQHVGDAEAGLGRDQHGMLGVDADHVLDLLLHPVRLGGGEVDLVENRHDLVVGVDGLVDVGQRLRLDPLGGVDHQQRTLDRAHRAGDLVGEVDVAGGVDQVEDIVQPVGGGVVQAHGLRLDGDAAFPLEVHRVEDLLLHLTVRQPSGDLDQPVGEGGFAVVDVSHDGEVADAREFGHGAPFAADSRARQAGVA